MNERPSLDVEYEERRPEPPPPPLPPESTYHLNGPNGPRVHRNGRLFTAAELTEVGHRCTGNPECERPLTWMEKMERDTVFAWWPMIFLSAAMVVVFFLIGYIAR